MSTHTNQSHLSQSQSQSQSHSHSQSKSQTRGTFRWTLRLLGISASCLVPMTAAALAQGTATEPAPTSAPTSAPAAASPAPAPPKVNLKEHNLGKKSLAIQGYDPVAYHPEGGNKPTKGLDTITVTHEGEVYRFATQTNADAFKANPAKYTPTYGGWCAWAVAKNKKVEIDPKAYSVENGQLYLFYSGDQVEDWNKSPDTYRRKADTAWLKISNESRVAQDAYAKHVEEAAKMKAEAPMATPTNPVAAKPLAAELTKIRDNFNAKAPEEIKVAFEQGIKDVDALNLSKTGLQIGQTVPDFTLPNTEGGNTTLATELAKGPVVVTFYRGGWCPYCNVQLKAMDSKIKEFDALGTRILAISPQLSHASLTTKKNDVLTFPVLSDVNNKVATSFGIAYEMPKVVTDKIQLDFADYNGSVNGAKLPLAATYIIGTDGKIAWSYVKSDYRERAEPDDILAALRAMKAAATTTPAAAAKP